MNVSNFEEQKNIMRKIKRLGTTIAYHRPGDKHEYDLTILIL